MRSYVNPFRSRTSEQVAHQGLDRYLRTFGVDALDMLPDNLWNRPLVIRSAPGAGKTSLLRAVSIDSILELWSHRTINEEMVVRLATMGVVDEAGNPQLLGFRVPLVRDYRSIVDLEPDPAIAQKTFLKLLDARIVASLCEAAGRLLRTLDPNHRLLGLTLHTDESAQSSLKRIGGPSIDGMRTWSRAAEEEILDRLNSVLPREALDEGHIALFSLRALSGAQLQIDGLANPVRPLLLLDDGQELARAQRRLVLEALHDRELSLPCWYTERYSAMEPEDLIGDGEPHRTNDQVRLELEAQRLGSGTRRGVRTRKYEKLLADIAGRRANSLLREYDNEDRDFQTVLDSRRDIDIDTRSQKAADAIKIRIASKGEEIQKYKNWFAEADHLEPVEAARRWRELEILIDRDRDRSVLPLFEMELTEDERKERSGSALREAADLFLRREFGLPYYFGSQRLVKLATENIEQYLLLAADAFDEMLAGITLRQGAAITPSRQDSILTLASARYWAEIPERRVGGRRIQQLLRQIAAMCRAETYRPKAPYAPGVTGTALSMHDRHRLLDPAVRSRLPGAQELFEALHGAIGHNLIRAETDRSVKGGVWMVLYLNRLTCVRYGLPLGYGGFRERGLEEMCRWMVTDVEDRTEPALQGSLEFR